MSYAEFESATATLAHGREHLRTLKEKSEAFFPTVRWTLGPVPSRNGRFQIVAMQMNTPMPLEFGHRAHDVVNSLRSALDHAVYGSTCVLGEPNVKAAFPFGETRDQLVRHHQLGPNYLHPTVRDAILAIDPCREGNELLWALNRMRNIGQHRMVRPADVAFESKLIELPPGTKPASPNGPVWNAKERRLDLYIEPRFSEGRSRFQFRFELGLGDGPLSGMPAVDTLARMADAVEAAVSTVEEATLSAKQAAN
jgi:hypothetical protein